MKEFHPPIHSRSTEELVRIANSTTRQWQQAAIDQARAELFKRNVGEEEQKKILEHLHHQKKQENEALEIKRAGNINISYSAREMFIMIVTLPVVFLIRRKNGDSLTELWRENFKTKFWQRLVLMVIGVCIWVGAGYFIAGYL